MKTVTRFTTMLCLFAPAAAAHFVWLELPTETPDTAYMRFSEEPLEETRERFQKLAQPMNVRLPGGDAVPFSVGEDALTAPVPADATVIAGALDYGVLDKREAGRGLFLLKYHAKAARTTADAGRSVGLPVEATAAVAGKVLTVTVTHNGKPAAGAELVVVVPQEMEPQEATAGEDGTATFPVTKAGWIGIRAMVADDKAGTHNDEAYELVRHYTTLAFRHGG